LIGDDYRGRALYKRNLVPVTHCQPQRDEARIQGEVGTLIAQIAKTRGQIVETRLQITAIDQNRFSDAQKELRESEGRIAELQERKIAAEDTLRRVDLQAAYEGAIHEIGGHQGAGSSPPSERLMVVVPAVHCLSRFASPVLISTS
jgi:HlyD family secretion protein